MSRNPPIFYFKSTNPKAMKEIKWHKPLQKLRCEENRINGTQCARKSYLGAGTCSWHLASEHKLRIKPSDIKINGKSIGLGLFTVSSGTNKKVCVFKKRTIILQYKGELVSKAELTRRYGNCTGPYCIGGPSEDKNGRYFAPYTDSALQRSTASYINHAPGKGANCRFLFDEATKSIAIEAVKDIYSDEELLSDYGENYILSGDLAGKHETRRNNQAIPTWYKSNAFGCENDKYVWILHRVCDECAQYNDYECEPNECFNS